MGEMREKTDVELLRDYAERGQEAAFRELVTRYTDLVYSAALRQLESTDLAGDITQGVFLDLARKARSVGERLAGHNSLVGWLHRSMRYAVLNHLRDTRRRVANERQAMEQLLHNSEASVDWEQIRPALDEALDCLADEDREALLLRYFKNHDLRTVGAALGVSDDAAQKRVSRAVERLREYFAKRGITVGVSGLVAVVSVNAVQAAPAGLALTISTAAALSGTAVATAATATATKAIAMTTLQKTLVATTVAVLAGVGTYEAFQTSHQRERLRSLEAQQAATVLQFQRELDQASANLAALQNENARLNRNASELLRLRGEVTRLRGEVNAAKEVNRNQLKDASSQIRDDGSVTNHWSPVETYTATARISMRWGQAMVTGGWKTPSGKRAFVLATPKRGEDAAQLEIQSRLVEIPEDTIASFGLARFLTDSKDVETTGLLTADEYEALLSTAADTEGVELVAAPAVSTVSGRQAQIQLGNLMLLSSGEEYSLGPAMDFVPTVSADGQSVDLLIIAKINYPSATGSR
jgi:RNA polymerase sigma factor (sigma-70 family)